jgi:hypothetical protein
VEPPLPPVELEEVRALLELPAISPVPPIPAEAPAPPAVRVVPVSVPPDPPSAGLLTALVPPDCPAAPDDDAEPAALEPPLPSPPAASGAPELSFMLEWESQASKAPAQTTPTIQLIPAKPVFMPGIVEQVSESE